MKVIHFTPDEVEDALSHFQDWLDKYSDKYKVKIVSMSRNVNGSIEPENGIFIAYKKKSKSNNVVSVLKREVTVLQDMNQKLQDMNQNLNMIG